MIFILGLDGLEYEFVEKWNLTHLKQREYNKIKVPIDKEIGVPLSPEVWASFLTGKYTDARFETIYSPLSIIFKILRLIRRYTNLSLGLSKEIRERTPRKWWVEIHTGFPPLKLKTFLDLTNSKPINVPYYNFTNETLKTLKDFGHAKLSLKQTIDALNLIYEERKKHILHAIEKLQDTDVTFAYIHFPDVIQHLLFTKPAGIKKHYINLDHYVSSLKSRLGDSTLFIIISDHGFHLQTGTHSKHGFYSSSANLTPKPKEITDFYKIITNLKSFSKPLEHTFQDACKS